VETIATARVAEPVRLKANEFILMPSRQLEALLAGPAPAAEGRPVDLFAATIAPDEQPTTLDPSETADERAADEMDPNETVDEEAALQDAFPVSPDADPADTLAEDDIALVDDTHDTAEPLSPGPADAPTLLDVPAAAPDGEAPPYAPAPPKPAFDDQQLPDYLR
jgi:hypothetical protein